MCTTGPCGDSSVLKLLYVPAARSASSSDAIESENSLIGAPIVPASAGSRWPARLPRRRRSAWPRRGSCGAPFGCSTILQASPDSSSANARSNCASSSSSVISGRRSTTPCSSSQRVLYQVANTSRPLTADTVRFLKMSASATSNSTGCAGMPKRITRPPLRTMRNASPIASGAPDISNTTSGCSPSFCSTNQAATSSTSRTSSAAWTPIFAARPSRNGVRSDASTRPAPDARAMPMPNSPTGPQPRIATVFPATSSWLEREDGVPERLLQRRDLRRQLRAIVLPDHRLRHGDVLRERAVAVDAEDLRALAHVRAAGTAVEAAAARDVALGRHVVADRDVTDGAAGVDDGPGELVAERERRDDPVLRPRVPAEDVQVGAADARRLDLDEHLVVARNRDGDLLQRETRLGSALADRPHGLHGTTMAGRPGPGHPRPAGGPVRVSPTGWSRRR